MRWVLSLVLAGLCPSLLLAGGPWVGRAASANPVESEAPDVAGQARKILSERCIRCHGDDQKKGGLDLSRRDKALRGGKTGEAIVPGEPDDSLLIEKVESGEMPPKSQLAEADVAALRGWIKEGAEYPVEPITQPRAGADWWSLQPIALPQVPDVAAIDPARWCRTSIDAFVLDKLNRNKLRPAPEADRASLLRRLSFDLLGLPPTPEELSAFVNDPNPLAYEMVVDRMLASPRYGERWARHWLDVVRFGESEGYETNAIRSNAWPYRDYVIQAFNRDLPFPRFVRDQLAGDVADDETGHRDGSWLSRAATGFLVGGTHDIVGNQTIEGSKQQRVDDLDDIITATATGFLALTVNCSRCHDHKFDPITQKDYYGLQAVFAGVNHASRNIPRPDSEERKAEATKVAAELASIESRLDATEPLARPDADTPGRPKVSPARNVERFTSVEARFVRMTILATNDQTEPCIDEIEVFTQGETPRNVALASEGGIATASSEYPGADIHKIVHLNDGRLGNSRSWISRVMGKGVVTIAWDEPAIIDRVVWGRDREGRFTDRLATDYYIEAALAPGDWRVIASSVDRASPRAEAAPVVARPEDGSASSAESEAKRAELLARQAKLRARLVDLGPTISVYAGTFSEPGPSHVLRRGDPMQPGDQVTPSAIASIRPPLVLPADAPERERRLALAKWIGDPANPLPARVMVNRIWHYHFGQGIVSTPSDFGFNGGVPSHPELLDWLAGQFIDGGWRLKPIHRMIVLSSAYRQSSRLDPEAEKVDRSNRLLWRMTPRRLEAEAIRDAILTCGGQLDSTMGGPGYNIWEKTTNYVAVYQPRAELGADAFRRMIYQFKPRSQQDPTFGAFDCPDAALVAPRRNSSTTALQALNLLNSRFIVRQSELFADRLKRDAGDDPAAQAARGFTLAFGRAPAPEELKAAETLIRDHGTPAFCRALFNANEFVFAP